MPENECNGQLITACSAMPGIATRNETCGTVSGGLMFLGLLYGGDGTLKPAPTPAETKKAVEKMYIATQYADKFKDKMGSTMCGEVHEGVMGKKYEFREYDALMKFYNDGASHKCQTVVETAIRLICDLVLDENGEIISRD